MSNTYTTKKGQQGDIVLEINGLQSICPWVNPFPINGNMGQVQLIRMPCTTACPFAIFNDEGDDKKWEMTCTGKKETLDVLNEIPKEPSKIFSI